MQMPVLSVAEKALTASRRTLLFVVWEAPISALPLARFSTFFASASDFDEKIGFCNAKSRCSIREDLTLKNRSTFLAFCCVVVLANAGFGTEPASGSGGPRLLLDMVHHRVDGPRLKSTFLDPNKLADWSYTGQVLYVFDAAQFGVTWDTFDKDVFPQGSQERAWVKTRAAEIEARYNAAKAAGLKVYCLTDMVVLPKTLIKKYGDQICNDSGKIDIHKPKAQEVLRALITETFDRFPQLDGIVIRTGETYLDEIPHHARGMPKARGMTITKPADHIALLGLLREEVCVKHGKTLIYRTWDFGKFHTRPDYYLQVTDAIKPHPNLVFSIKHHRGDFARMTPFNPTVMLGKHPQIVEVCCQDNTHGKGAYPYYIGRGVIEGWEEYDYIMEPGRPRGLRDVVHHPNYAGIWTWSRCEAHAGPYIKSEFWCALNTYVVSQWARDPTRSEKEVFNEFARKIELKGMDVDRFRRLCLLSSEGALRGHDTYYCGINNGVGNKSDLNVWWAREDFIGGIDQLRSTFERIIKDGKVEEALAEKAEAVAIWQRIEALARQLDLPNKQTKEFIVTSATYGRISYAIFEQGWTVMLFGYLGDKSGTHDRERIAKAIAAYDRLWDEWRTLKAASPSCPTIYRDTFIGWSYHDWGTVCHKDRPGIGASVDKYRAIVTNGGAK